MKPDAARHGGGSPRRARACHTLGWRSESKTLKQALGAASTSSALLRAEPSVPDSTTPQIILADRERLELSPPTLTGSRSTFELPANMSIAEAGLEPATYGL